MLEIIIILGMIIMWCILDDIDRSRHSTRKIKQPEFPKRKDIIKWKD